MQIIDLIIPPYVRYGLGVAAAVIGGAVIGAGASAYSAKKAGDSADKSIKAQQKAANAQLSISQQQQDMAKEQWDLYKNQILPLEQEAQKLGISAQELAQQRGELDLKAYQDYYLPMQESFAGDAMAGIEADPERAAREARMNVNQAFDSAEGSMTRDLQRRGVRADSGAYNQDISLNRAAAQGMAVNSAIEGERDRVEDVNFNRKATALGRQPLASNPTQSPGSPGVTAGTAMAGMAGAGNTAYGAGSQFGNMANTYGNAAGGAVSSGIQLGTQAYDLYNKYQTNQSVQNYGFAPGGGSTYAMGGGYGTIPNSTQSSMLAEQNAGFAEGGPVNAPNGPLMLSRGAPNPGGMVNGPPGRDQVPAYIEGNNGEQYPARLQNQEYVVPADVVRDVGEGTLDDIIAKSRERKMKMQNQNALQRPGGRS